MGKNYHELAAQVVELVGGKENISHDGYAHGTDRSSVPGICDTGI